jgi:ABC-2 type transport system permease protein
MLHAAVARRSFRRYSTYVGATLAGVFTNSVFGIIACFVYLAVWKVQPEAGGYDATDAVTYAWIGQAMIMTAGIFGGGSPDDLAQRVRSGDIALDFYRPVGILGWYAAADLGRAAYHLLSRGIAPTLVGALLFDIRWPQGLGAWLGVAVALLLAVVVSFAVRFLVATSSFWLLDDAGVRMLSITAAMFFTGLTVPLVLFPGWSRDVVMVLPWAAYLQVPADIWLGHRVGTEVLAGLALQIFWAVVLLGACTLVMRVAERRVVVQGG